jgi:hypothetical protein
VHLIKKRVRLIDSNGKDLPPIDYANPWQLSGYRFCLIHRVGLHDTLPAKIQKLDATVNMGLSNKRYDNSIQASSLANSTIMSADVIATADSW